MDKSLQIINTEIPVFFAWHWLLSLRLAGLFFKQRISKFPVKVDYAVPNDSQYLAWWFVACGKLCTSANLILAALFLLELYRTFLKLATSVICFPSSLELHCDR